MFSLFAAWFPGGATLFQPYIRWPRSLTEPDLKIYRLFRQVHSLSADSRVGFGDNVFPGSVSRIVSPPRYTYLSTPSLHQRYPASSVLWVDPTTCTSSSNLVPSAPSTPLPEEGTGPPRFLGKSLAQHAVDYDPGGVSTISPSNDGFVAAFRVLNPLGLLHNLSVFEAEFLHPYGLRPAVSLFTLHPYSYLHRC